MSTPLARINEFRTAVASSFGAAMPELRQCEAQFGRFNLADLENNSIPAPAIRVAVLKARGADQASARISADLSCAAFIITAGRDRDAQAWTLAEAVVKLLHSGQMFGLLNLTTPDKVEVQPLLAFPLKQRAVAIISVEWQQQLRHLGETIFNDEGQLLPELYLNDEPVSVDAEGANDG